MGTLASGSIDLKSLSVAGAPNKYITHIDGSGVRVHEAGLVNSNFAQLNASGLQIYKGGNNPNNVVASFGTEVIIGKNVVGNSNVKIKDVGISFFDGVDEAGFIGFSSDNPGSESYRQIYNNWSSYSYNQDYTVELPIDYGNFSNVFEITLTVNDIAYTFSISSDGTKVQRTLGSYGLVEMWCEKVNDNFKLMIYNENMLIVDHNRSLETDTTEINYQIIRKFSSFGFGNSVISTGKGSFATGSLTQALGDYSHTGGNGTIAVADYQTVFGKYNEEDADAMFIIGNGSDNINRSNLMTIGDNLIRIGNLGQSHLLMDYHSLQLISKEGDTYFHVSDLRDINGYLTDNFTGDGEENMFTFSVYGCDSVIKVTIDGVEQEQDTYYYFLDHITFNEAPSNNAEIIVIYTVATTKCQALTFGNRKENQSIGIYSIALGDNNSARGICSSAIGRNVTTGGDYSLAIGNSISAMGRGTIATGIDAREQVQIGTSYNAQGAIVGGYISSLAKSNSYITNGGKGSIVVGCIEDGGDMGSSSFGTAALGIGTWALGKGQTVIGTFNSLDTQGNTSNHPKNTDPAYTKYAFIIGNGYYDTTNDEEIRSNALTVDWNGNITVNNHASHIGTIKNAYYATDISVPNNTAKSLCSFTLEPGTWLIECGFRSSSNANGYRRGGCSTVQNQADMNIQIPAVSGERTQARWTISVIITQTTTYYLSVYQNSGSTLTYAATGAGYGNFMRAIRIL